MTWSVDDLRIVESAADMAWAAQGEGIGLTEALAGSPKASWIFDHLPKAGGSEFGRLCEAGLPVAEHLGVAWPGSWIGVTYGRLLRASLVHGHGARLASTLLPQRQWKAAVLLRTPADLVVSQYQQVTRHAGVEPIGGPQLAEWIEHELERRGPVVQLNFQCAWLATDRPLTLEPPYYEEILLAADTDAMTEAAATRLAGYQAVTTVDRVTDLFELIASDCGFRPSLEPAGPPANQSAVSSLELLTTLSSESRSLLDASTAADRTLLAQAPELTCWLGI